jgi:hypothetical protein
MKTFTGIFFLVFFNFSIAYSQGVPNPSFENWVIGVPVGWYGFGIGQTTDSYSGDYAISLHALNDNIVPILIAGEITPGIVISERYESFKGYYKLNPNGNDFLKVDVIVGTEDVVMGIGSSHFFATTPGLWFEFTVPIEYSSEGIPNTALIFFSITNNEQSVDPGSNAVVDMVSFDLITDIGQVSAISDKNLQLKNFPNPFDLSTTISFTLNKPSKVTLEIYSMTGQKIASLINDKLINQGHKEIFFDSSDLPSGLYFYTLSSDAFIITKKMNCIK